jgi:hypothetical protein
MQIKDSRYHRIWKIEVDQNGRKKINIGDSKKNQDGTYTSWTWAFCNLVGNAKGIQIEEQDTITIVSGKIEQYKNNNGEYKNSITIFEMEVTAKGNQQNNNQSNSYGNNQKPNVNQSYQQNNNSMGNSNDPNDPNFIPF